jgi:hypothetical protein
VAQPGRRLTAPICPAGMEPVNEQEFRAIIDRLVRELQPEKIVLFGSNA